MARIVAWTMVTWIAGSSLATAQTTIHGGIEIGRAEHRVMDQSALLLTSGTVFGGSAVLAIGSHYVIQGRATAGKLTLGSTPSIEDHDLADAQLLGGRGVNSWLLVQGGIDVRNFSSSLARQHWTAWLVGAESRVPLAFDGVTATAQAYWLPVVTVSGLRNPDVALRAGLGLEWRGRQLSAGITYAFERYDFPSSNGARRLEEFSMLRLRVSTWWPRHPSKQA